MGIMLAVGAIYETGITSNLTQFIDTNIHNVWVMGVITGVISCFLDTFATCMSIISLYSVGDIANLAFSSDPNYMSSFVQNGIFGK